VHWNECLEREMMGGVFSGGRAERVEFSGFRGVSNC